MKKALLVIDMQNDYLWEKRKKRFSYDTAQLTANVNSVIHEFHEKGDDVIYIRHLIQNLLTNRIIFGFSIAGTKGAELFSGLDVVSDLVFNKLLPNALAMKDLREHMKSQGYESVSLAGIDLCGCVGATALGAIKLGYKTEVIEKAVSSKSHAEKVRIQRDKLAKAGVVFV